MQVNGFQPRFFTRFGCAALLIAALLAGLTGCDRILPDKTDYSAAELVLTSAEEAALDTLAKYENLQKLDLRQAEMTAEAVAQLKAGLPECEILWSVPLGGERFDSASTQLTLPAQTTPEELALLGAFPALASVDATQCAVSDALVNLSKTMPGTSFRWVVSIGGTTADNAAESLDLSNRSDLDAAELTRCLAWLPALQSVDLSGSGLSADDVAALAAAYPGITFAYTVDVFGESVPSDTESLDLSAASFGSADELIKALSPLSALRSADVSGHTFTADEMDAVTAAYPDVTFNFAFTVLSQEVTSETTELDLRGNVFSSPEEVLALLQHLPKLVKVDLCDCGLSNEQMETLMAARPETKFVWKVQIGAWVIRTDCTAFSKGNWAKTFNNGWGGMEYSRPTNLHSEDIEPLKYCQDLIYLDLGHGNSITDVSVIGQLPKLQALIVSMNDITDISPLANCKELVMLEIYQNYITDLTPVTQLPKLKYLNCSSLTCTDFSPLFGLKQLEMLWMVHTKITSEQKEQLVAALPDCNICFRAVSSGEGGWVKNGLYETYQKAFGF